MSWVEQDNLWWKQRLLCLLSLMKSLAWGKERGRGGLCWQEVNPDRRTHAAELLRTVVAFCVLLFQEFFNILSDYRLKKKKTFFLTMWIWCSHCQSYTGSNRAHFTAILHWTALKITRMVTSSRLYAKNMGLAYVIMPHLFVSYFLHCIN